VAVVVIGGERENVTIHARLLPRPDPGPGMMQAHGSFCAGRLRGEFETLIESPERFVDDLVRMNDTLHGEARWCGVDDDFDLVLKFESMGAIAVKAKFHDFSKFDAVIKFGIDQTYLPQIIGSLRDTLLVSQ
jgi:hypothetical protein